MLPDSSCEKCRAGFYQNATNQLDCLSCGVGFYQNETGKDFCYKCSDMKVTYKLGAEMESLCRGNHCLTFL